VIEIAIKQSRIIYARLLNLFIAGGMVLSLIAMLKAFFDLMFAFRESTSPDFSLDSLPLYVSSSSFSPSSFSISPPLSLNNPAF